MPPRRPPQIKTIIPVQGSYFAAFLPDKENGIPQRISKILCWSLIQYPKPDEPDEVVGQIIVGDTITEVTNVDEEEGFGELLSYFESVEEATTALMTAVAESEGEEASDDDAEEEEEEEDEDEEEEEEEESSDDDNDDDDDDDLDDEDDDDLDDDDVFSDDDDDDLDDEDDDD